LKRTIIITGGAGFIGSHVVRLFVNKYPDYKIINLDALTYAGNLENLRDVEQSPNYVFEKVNILNENDIERIFSKYQPTIYVFEPVSDFYSNIIERFKHNPKVKVFPLGLGAENQFVPISIGADSSSIHRSIGDHKEIVRIVRAADFLEKENINYIHLMKINIEGGEYDLLDHLIDTGCVRRIENIQVQFHNFVPESQDRMSNLQARLAKTHIVTWQYEFVWENWRLKKGSNHYE